MTKRKQYSPEIKREAIKLTKQLCVSCRQIALEIGINPNLLSYWKREAEIPDDKAFQGSGAPRYMDDASQTRSVNGNAGC